MTYDIIIGRDASDKERFGDKGLIYIGKGYVKMGNYTSLSNKIYMDVARSHVVLVAGKRGCLEGGTLIFTDKGYKKIKEFDENNDRILSFNKETKEFDWENAKLLQYPIENEKLFKIEFEDGREIIMTKEHPLLSSYGKYNFWRKAKELKIGDKIVLPIELPEIKGGNESMRLARLLGYILADGNISIRKGLYKDGKGYWYNGTKARIRIFNADNEVLSQAKEDLENEFDTYAKRYQRNDCNCEVVQVLDQRIINKFISLDIPKGNKSAIIRIPRIVFKSSNEFKANFINALFCCDGYIEKTGRYIEYSSKSKEFVLGLQLLLGHFKIESSIREKISKLDGKEFESYRLFITDNQSVDNFKKIGFIIKSKQEKLNNHKFNNTKRRKTRYIGENLVCKRIKNITEVEGIAEVYDLMVPKNHSFIANGIISHNSGKSYTLGVIAEELANLPFEVSRNIASLIFDTMGIFWTMKYENEKDKDLLREWQLGTKSLPVRIFVPFGKVDEYKEKNIPVDDTFAIKISELEAEDWITLFNLPLTSLPAVLIQRMITELRDKLVNFTLEDIQMAIEHDRKANSNTKEIASTLFSAADNWGIFSREKEGTEISDLIKAGTTSVLDVSVYSSIGAYNIRALVISLITRKLFKVRMDARKEEELESIRHGQDYLSYSSERAEPLVWIFIDEAQEFLPRDAVTPATDALKQLLREGRQPGISLVLATQQPGQIHKDVMTQSDIVIAHRVTSKPDVEALNDIMQTYLLEDIKQQMDELPSLKGSAVILDDNSERLYPVRVRPRFTWHGGEAPTAIRAEIKL